MLKISRRSLLKVLSLSTFSVSALEAASIHANESESETVSTESVSVFHPSNDPAWELTFEDDFKAGILDQSKWFPGYRLGRMEYYRKLGFPNEHGRAWQPQPPMAHYLLEDSVLKLRVDKDLPKRPTPETLTVSCVTTAIYRHNEQTGSFDDEVRFAQKYGWFEIRCRMPKCGSGRYTAFWLHSVGAENQEYTPEGVRKSLKDGALEIDIFEWLGRSPKENLFNVHFTKNGHCAFSFDFDITKDFHTWALNWEEGRLTWYLDGKKIRVYEGPTPQNEMYILAAMFQAAGWTGPLDMTIQYPVDFEIDYIRVWKKK